MLYFYIEKSSDRLYLYAQQQALAVMKWKQHVGIVDLQLDDFVNLYILVGGQVQIKDIAYYDVYVIVWR